MSDTCGDSRDIIIDKAKDIILNYTNIADCPDEMKVLDSFLLRCWQMGWLNSYTDGSLEAEIEKLHDSLDTIKRSYQSQVSKYKSMYEKLKNITKNKDDYAG